MSPWRYLVALPAVVLLAVTLLLAPPPVAAAEPSTPGDQRDSDSDDRDDDDDDNDDDGDDDDDDDNDDGDDGLKKGIDWSVCFQTFEDIDKAFGPFPPESREEISGLLRGKSFECADVAVPLDYDEPQGQQISVAVVRRLASDQANKVGSLFTNPGGPGAGGRDLPIFLDADSGLSEEVFARFDLIGIDPRGIAESTPLRCFESAAAVEKFNERHLFSAYPVTDEEVEEHRRFSAELADSCKTNAGPIINHMSTANVARDFDFIREAIGEESMNFLGYSYGTQIGMTYANLFPERVRTLVIDGNINADLYSRDLEQTGLPSTVRMNSGTGDQETFGEWVRLCETHPDRCPMAPNTEARVAAIAEALAEEPLDLIDPATEDGLDVITEQSFYGEFAGVLRGPGAFEEYAKVLPVVEQLLAGRAAGETEPPAGYNDLLNFLGLVDDGEQQPEFPDPVDVGESFYGVLCSDTENPGSFDAWRAAAEYAAEVQGPFGPSWAWSSSPCAHWPGVDEDAFVGPYDATPANTALVVNNRFDGPTPYRNAVTNAEALGNARLVTVNGWGHIAGGSSKCADQVVSDYLVSGRAPADDVECDADKTPFVDSFEEENPAMEPAGSTGSR